MQLGLAASWLFVGAVFILTPKRMAQALALPDTVREGAGLVVVVLAILVAVGAITRGRTMLATLSTAAIAAVGILWSIYDISRNWIPFAYFHAGLVVLAITVLFVRVRAR